MFNLHDKKALRIDYMWVAEESEVPVFITGQRVIIIYMESGAIRRI